MTDDVITEVPAPWTLTGSGYIILVKLSERFVKENCFVPDSMAGSFSGGIGTIMLVDYVSSDAGPYKELLFIPGRFCFQGRNLFSITKIYVSTMNSVVNGIRNWGIPKELAQFDILQTGHESMVRISMDGSCFAELSFKHYPVHVPMTTALAPPGLRSLGHHYQSRTYITRISARGSVCPARLVSARIDQTHFPDFTAGKVLATFYASKFLMVFPVPQAV